MMKFLGILAAIFCLSINTVDAQKKKKEFAPELRSQIENREYTIDVNTALPLRGKTVHLSGSNFIEIKGDTLVSALPYFGRAYSAPLSGETGLGFTSVIEEYSFEEKKGECKIEFKVRGNGDTHTFYVNIFHSGSASINVQSNNRQSIRFSGEVEELESTD